jgi:hypothetical protein
MTTAKELLKQGRRDEVWQKYCGFFDLSIEQFMEIQRDLLMEQIQALANCQLGQELLGGRIPKNINEFRQQVPLTTYENYSPYLPEKRENVLPPGDYDWVRTSGRSKGGGFKWVPCSKRMSVRNGEAVVSGLVTASCSQKGEVYLEPGDILLMMTAPPPYVSALYTRAANDEMDIRFLPSLDEGEKMEFRERMALGFELAMQMGLDYFYGLSSVLAKLGEQFEKGAGGSGLSSVLRQPRVLFRVLRGFLSAKLKNRGLLPRDIWKVKGIVAGGTDTDIYRDRIDYYWGRKPLEAYGSTEGGGMAFQAWNYQGMTFFPDINFLEFISQEELEKGRTNPGYSPRSLFLDEVKPGVYELVITNLLGGIFTRYRVGDLVEVTSLRDDELDIDLPQIQFYSRADDLIDLASFVRFTEKTIWQAIEMSEMGYEDWVARKEELDGEPVLHIYVEPKEAISDSTDDMLNALKKSLRNINPEFADMEEMLSGNCVRLSLLPIGAFAQYIDTQQKAGADLAHIKPPHMQPTDTAMKQLLDVKEA